MTQPEPQEVGWRVLDPEGRVIDSGTVLIMTGVADTGEPPSSASEE